jgi:hypothetical protein
MELKRETIRRLSIPPLNRAGRLAAPPGHGSLDGAGGCHGHERPDEKLNFSFSEGTSL